MKVTGWGFIVVYYNINFILFFQLIVEAYPNLSTDMSIILMGIISRVLPHTPAIITLNWALQKHVSVRPLDNGVTVRRHANQLVSRIEKFGLNEAAHMST